MLTCVAAFAASASHGWPPLLAEQQSHRERRQAWAWPRRGQTGPRALSLCRTARTNQRTACGEPAWWPCAKPANTTATVAHHGGACTTPSTPENLGRKDPASRTCGSKPGAPNLRGASNKPVPRLCGRPLQGPPWALPHTAR
eukprot:376092-Alexandrium_andersonii.AAC.1